MLNKLSFTLAVVFIFMVCSQAVVAESEQFVGSERCADCHETQYLAWQGSHHDMAMRHANAESVLGDFGNISFDSNGKKNRFYRNENEYWVNIEGPDGQLHDYQIEYTFGFKPLQQYMVEFDDGRIQLIPFAWDSRSKEDGGQRWFNLYPEQSQKHQEFFWTNTGQNWNYMCADCHSTNVKKNFDVDTNTYQTTYSEINVGCEACHGPASEHIRWSQSSNESDKSIGFSRNLSKSVKNWDLKQGDTTLSPREIDPSQQTLVCAQCHSRHVQISDDDHVQSNALGDRYLMSLINSRLYYPDGQVYDEAYVYGSFLQSKMNKNGVVCSNCHDPHTAKISLPEKELCLQCHQAETYTDQSHHHHPSNSAGAQCVNCHMPETTYMEVDARRDHAWHIPRPELAQKLGTPDTCLSCHEDKDSHWSLQHTQSWFPESKALEEQPFAPIFSAIDQGYQEAAAALSHIAQNASNAAIIRASALERMNQYSDPNALIAITRGAKHSDENIRIGAIRGAEGIQSPERWRILAPLLDDKVLSVRTEAARVLMPLWQSLSQAQRSTLSPALDEYLEIQTFNSDRGFAHTNMANVMVYQGKFNAAEQAYKESIRIEPYFANAYVNLADLYRQQKQETESLRILKLGAEANPDNGSLLYGIGLAHIRAKQPEFAAQYLNKATTVEPENAHFHYVYGLSLAETKPKLAQAAIRKAYVVSGNPQHLYALCEMQIQQKAFQAKRCVEELRKVAPKTAVMALEKQLSEKHN